MADVFFFMLMGTLVLYRDTLDICRRHYGHVWMPQRVRTICQSWGLLCVGHDMLQLWFCTVNMIHQTWWSLSISRQFFFQWNLWTLKKSYPTNSIVLAIPAFVPQLLHIQIDFAVMDSDFYFSGHDQPARWTQWQTQDSEFVSQWVYIRGQPDPKFGVHHFSMHGNRTLLL